MLRKLKKMSELQSAALLLVVAFAIVVTACPGDEVGGTNDSSLTTGSEIGKDYVSGDDALSWGIKNQASVLTLGLTPGSDTTKINLNWYSSGAPAGKVAKVRFVRGTFTNGLELLEEETTSTSGAGVPLNSNTAHKATVTGLKPGASYQYAVSSDGTNWSEAYDFKVPADTGSFKFAVIADPQLHASTWDANNRYVPNTLGSKTAKGWLDTMEKIVNHGVSFIASGGDQVDTTSNGNEAEYEMFFAPPGLRNLPFAPVSGNHDRHLPYNYHYNWPNAQKFETGSNAETLNTNQGRNYFYLYNNILFVVLDTAPYPNGTSQGDPLDVEATRPHIARFEATINAALAAFPKSTSKWDWLIVQHHKSTASVADHCADIDIQGYVEAGFEELMSRKGVDFVLAGHDHVYARSYPLQGKDGGLVSVPDKTKGTNDNHEFTNPGNPIYLTFTTGSGLKYYQVATDKQFPYNNTLYVQNNAAYPYLGESTNDFKSSQYGSASYLTKQYLPVSTAVFVQPYIPSYCIAEVNGKTITFNTYAIVTATGTSSATIGGSNVNADEAYTYNENTPYDWVKVTKN